MANIHPRLDTLLTIGGAVADAAGLAARAAQRQINRTLRPRRGYTLKPGVDTPLWNELAQALRTKLKKRGDRVNLGRFLGLPRQRIDDFITGKRALPDAERTLMLLQWLDAKNRGIDLS